MALAINSWLMSSQIVRGLDLRIWNRAIASTTRRLSLMTRHPDRPPQTCKMVTSIQYMKKRRRSLRQISRVGLKAGQLSHKEVVSTQHHKQIEATKEGVNLVNEIRADHKMIEVREDQMLAEILRMPGLQHHKKT